MNLELKFGPRKKILESFEIEKSTKVFGKFLGSLITVCFIWTLNQPQAFSQQIFVNLDTYQAEVELKRFFSVYTSNKCEKEESKSRIILVCEEKTFSLYKKNENLVLEVSGKINSRTRSGLVMIIASQDLKDLQLKGLSVLRNEFFKEFLD